MILAGPPQIARYAIAPGDWPPIVMALQVGEALRAALMGMRGAIAKKHGMDSGSVVFSGKSSDGQLLQGHRHAYFLATDENADRLIDHLTVFAPCGFPDIEILALTSLKLVRFNRSALRLNLLGIGAASDYCPPPFQSASVWASATPYIATRRAKFRGRTKIDPASNTERTRFLIQDLHGQIAQVRPELADSILTISPQSGENAAFVASGGINVRDFDRNRRRSPDSGNTRLTGAFRVVFAAPVRGPLALGWGNHLGMGLFLPVATVLEE